MNFIKRNKENVSELIRRIRKKEISEHGKQAIKNSTYQFLQTLVSKIGAFILTIILARLLMPELFGLYTLALSTILIFVSFSDLGLNETMVRFISKELGKKNEPKARAYSIYLTKTKIIIMILASIVLILSSKFIANDYYHKPIYLALIAGSLYITFVGIVVIFQNILQAYNIFKPIFYREVLFQAVRLAVIPVAVIYALKAYYNQEITVFLIITILSLSFAFACLLLYISLKKSIFKKKVPRINLSKLEKKRVNRFWLINSTILLSGVFFGYIDIVMLGYFVPSQYIGYYQAAFSFLYTVIPLITFSGALLPIFSQLSKKITNDFVNKVTNVIYLISILSFLFIFFAAKPLILIIYGSSYLASINILKILSILLISIPVTTIYSTYFLSAGKPEIVSKTLISSTIINIVLNYLLISYLVKISPLYAVYGAAGAAIISRYLYTLFLVIYKRKSVKFKS